MAIIYAKEGVLTWRANGKQLRLPIPPDTRHAPVGAPLWVRYDFAVPAKGHCSHPVPALPPENDEEEETP